MSLPAGCPPPNHLEGVTLGPFPHGNRAANLNSGKKKEKGVPLAGDEPLLQRGIGRRQQIAAGAQGPFISDVTDLKKPRRTL